MDKRASEREAKHSRPPGNRCTPAMIVRLVFERGPQSLGQTAAGRSHLGSLPTPQPARAHRVWSAIYTDPDWPRAPSQARRGGDDDMVDGTAWYMYSTARASGPGQVFGGSGQGSCPCSPGIMGIRTDTDSPWHSAQ